MSVQGKNSVSSILSNFLGNFTVGDDSRVKFDGDWIHVETVKEGL